MFIVLEGLACSGKRTVSELIAKQYDYVIFETPSGKFLKVDRIQIDSEASPSDHYRYYLKGVHTAAEEIKEKIERGENIVCNRYWMSTYVYHRVMGVPVNMNDFTGIIQPDLTILLLVSAHNQGKRFWKRGIGMSDAERRLKNRQYKVANEYEQLITNLHIPKLVIDTDNKSPEEVFSGMLLNIKEYDLSSYEQFTKRMRIHYRVI